MSRACLYARCLFTLFTQSDEASAGLALDCRHVVDTLLFRLHFDGHFLIAAALTAAFATAIMAASSFDDISPITGAA